MRVSPAQNAGDLVGLCSIDFRGFRHISTSSMALRASGCNFSRFRGRTRVLTLWDVCGVHGDVKFVAILLFPVHHDTGSGFISQKLDEIEP